MTEFGGTTMADGRLVNSIGFEKKKSNFFIHSIQIYQFFSTETPNVISQCGELRVHKECELNFFRFNLHQQQIYNGSPSMISLETCIHRGLDVSSVLSKAPMKTLHVVHCVVVFFAAPKTGFKIRGREGGSGRNRKEGARTAAKKEGPRGAGGDPHGGRPTGRQDVRRAGAPADGGAAAGTEGEGMWRLALGVPRTFLTKPQRRKPVWPVAVLAIVLAIVFKKRKTSPFCFHGVFFSIPPPPMSWGSPGSADATGRILTDHSVDDVMLQFAALKLHLPPEAAVVETEACFGGGG